MSTIEQRLQILEDKEAIRDLLLAYGTALDSRDTQGFADLFAEDGEWSGGVGRSSTPAGIKKMLDDLFVNATGKLTAHHLMGNMQIAISGDTATASSRWMWITAASDGKPAMTRAGRYEDAFVRVAGQWKFRRRQAVNEYTDALPVQQQKS